MHAARITPLFIILAATHHLTAASEATLSATPENHKRTPHYPKPEHTPYKQFAISLRKPEMDQSTQRFAPMSLVIDPPKDPSLKIEDISFKISVSGLPMPQPDAA
jgi:hypothetical protein